MLTEAAIAGAGRLPARAQGERHHRQAHSRRHRCSGQHRASARGAAHRGRRGARRGALPEGFGEEYNVFLAEGAPPAEPEREGENPFVEEAEQLAQAEAEAEPRPTRPLPGGGGGDLGARPRARARSGAESLPRGRRGQDRVGRAHCLPPAATTGSRPRARSRSVASGMRDRRPPCRDSDVFAPTLVLLALPWAAERWCCRKGGRLTG